MSFFSPDVFGATWQNSIEFSLLSWQKLSCSRRGMCPFAKVRNVTPFVAKTTGHDGQGASPLTPPRGKMSHWCRCPESASATSWEISPDPQTSSALDGITGYHWDVPYFGSLQLSFHGEMARLCQTYKCHWSHVSGLMKGSMTVLFVCRFIPCASASNLTHMNLGCHGDDGGGDDDHHHNMWFTLIYTLHIFTWSFSEELSHHWRPQAEDAESAGRGTARGIASD